jgi:hypothetical protein
MNAECGPKAHRQVSPEQSEPASAALGPGAHQSVQAPSGRNKMGQTCRQNKESAHINEEKVQLVLLFVPQTVSWRRKKIFLHGQ